LKRVVFLSIAAAVALAATLLVATASARSSARKSVAFHLVEKDVAFNFIDNPPKGGPNDPPLIGDEFAFTSELLNKSGQRAGELDAMCMVTRGGSKARGLCHGVFALKGGQLAGITLVSLNGNGQDRIAIVGGTGVYEGVSGSVLSRSRGANSDFSDDTVHLVWP
jgi:hypothetical protein